MENKHIVYEVIDNANVIYIGETSNFIRRKIMHMQKPHTSNKSIGKFHNMNVEFNIIGKYDNRKESFAIQNELQRKFGLKVDGSAGGMKFTSVERTCPHCGVSSKSPVIYRHHFKNCKLR